MTREPGIPPILPLIPKFLTSSPTSTPTPSSSTSHALPKNLEEGFLLTFASDVARKAQLLRVLSQNITIMHRDKVIHLEQFLLPKISAIPEEGRKVLANPRRRRLGNPLELTKKSLIAPPPRHPTTIGSLTTSPHCPASRS
jgi:hypothetical protein